LEYPRETTQSEFKKWSKQSSNEDDPESDDNNNSEFNQEGSDSNFDLLKSSDPNSINSFILVWYSNQVHHF
jgi:hypothetical protein